MAGELAHEEIVVAEEAGLRLDIWLSRRHPHRSRSQWQKWILEGRVTVNGAVHKAHHRVAAGDRIAWTDPPPPELPKLEPEPIPLRVLFEDDDIIVIDKPAGLVVHPAPGHPTGTLVHALLYWCSSLSGVGGERRPGIVHRLDRDTTGVMVVAKTDMAMETLQRQFRLRKVRKVYQALVWGAPEPSAGRIQTLIGRSPVDRKKMSSRVRTGRLAITEYETLAVFGPLALVRLVLITGRTHQVRVHMAHIGHPVIGDPLYGPGHRRALPVAVTRQMLHAATLGFTHPRTGEMMEFTAPLPEDMRSVMAALRGQQPNHSLAGR